MRRMQNFRLALAMGVLGVTTAGCGGRDLPETVTVTGSIMHAGQPVPDAEIGFVPTTEGKEVYPARGRTDAKGNFTLTTYFGPQDNVKGATPGEFVVTVEKRDIPTDPSELQKHFQKNPQAVPKNVLPTRYLSPKSSDLKATVKTDGDNNFPYELREDDPPQKKKK